MTENKVRGKVKWFDTKRGYGFIGSDAGDVFVHYTAMLGSGYKTLNEGEEVEYELAVSAGGSNNGRRAKNVARLTKLTSGLSANSSYGRPTSEPDNISLR